MYAGLLEEHLLYKPVEFEIESDIGRHAVLCTNPWASQGTTLASLLHRHQKGENAQDTGVCGL